MCVQNKRGLVFSLFDHFCNTKNVCSKQAGGCALIFNEVNGYFEEINGNKYLTLIPTNEGKEKTSKYEELWSKIKDLIR